MAVFASLLCGGGCRVPARATKVVAGSYSESIHGHHGRLLALEAGEPVGVELGAEAVEEVRADERPEVVVPADQRNLAHDRYHPARSAPISSSRVALRAAATADDPERRQRLAERVEVRAQQPSGRASLCSMNPADVHTCPLTSSSAAARGISRLRGVRQVPALPRTRARTALAVDQNDVVDPCRGIDQALTDGGDSGGTVVNEHAFLRVLPAMC
jgi:hypothetical protein